MKRSKKQWDWTEKNRRRTRMSQSRGHRFCVSSPNYYTRIFKRSNKIHVRKVLHQLDPKDLSEFDVYELHHNRCGQWWW